MKRTVMKVAKLLKIPVYKVYDEIRSGRIEIEKEGYRIYVTNEGFLELKRLQKLRGNLIPLRDYLKEIRISVSQYYRRRYMGDDFPNLVRVGGRLFIRREK